MDFFFNFSVFKNLNMKNREIQSKNNNLDLRFFHFRVTNGLTDISLSLSQQIKILVYVAKKNIYRGGPAQKRLARLYNRQTNTREYSFQTRYILFILYMIPKCCPHVCSCLHWFYI